MAGQLRQEAALVPRPRQWRGVDVTHCYRGDIINELAFTARRRADPNCGKDRQMLRDWAYTLQAAATLNLVRAFSTGGFADIHRVHSWSAWFYRPRRVGENVSGDMVQSDTEDSIDFMRCRRSLTGDNNARVEAAVRILHHATKP